ncbi:MAG: hypothetical protein AAF518_01275 [Spirochaetota bacterium]
MKLQCKQCSGTDFTKVTENEYQCNYCGTRELRWFQPDTFGAASKQEAKKFLPFALALLVIIGFLLFSTIFYRFQPTKDEIPSEPTVVSKSSEHSSDLDTQDAKVPPQQSQEFSVQETEKDKPINGKFYNIQELPDSIGNIYFVGFFKNTGEGPIRKPMVVVELYSLAGEKVGSGRGYGFHDFLLPGEETPLRVLVSSAPKYKTYKANYKVEPPYRYMKIERPKCKVQKVQIQTGKYGGKTLRGQVVNESSRPMQFTQLAAILYDAKKKIIGYYTNYIPAKEVAGGDYSPFSINMYSIKGKMSSYRLECISKFP